MNRGTRDELLATLAARVESVRVAHPTRVAVDGPPAAGKTTLADGLAAVLRAHGCEVIRTTIDDFLFPRAIRYRRGEYSAEGCYFDAHDYGALNRVLLDPLGPDGDGRFRSAVYDHATDTAIRPARQHSALGCGTDRRRRLPPAAGAGRSVGAAHSRVDRFREDAGAGSDTGAGSAVGR